MKYFGIKTPSTEGYEAYVWWISNTRSGAWKSFFQYPDKYDRVYAYRLPLEEAIRAYEAIGYKCVELDVKEKIE